MLVHIINYDVSCPGWNSAWLYPNRLLLGDISVDFKRLVNFSPAFHKLTTITQFLSTSLKLGSRTYSHNHNSDDFGVYFFMRVRFCTVDRPADSKNCETPTWKSGITSKQKYQILARDTE